MPWFHNNNNISSQRAPIRGKDVKVLDIQHYGDHIYIYYVKTLQLQPRYQIGQDIYTCRQAMDTTTLKNKKREKKIKKKKKKKRKD